jgi:hypothetical protein
MSPKPVKRVDLSKLSPEQKQAVAKFYKDCQTASPHVKEMQDAAQKVFQAWLQAPEWVANEGPKPEQVPNQMWSVKPEINYVDHIEGSP